MLLRAVPKYCADVFPWVLALAMRLRMEGVESILVLDTFLHAPQIADVPEIADVSDIAHAQEPVAAARRFAPVIGSVFVCQHDLS
jgi:hypothetical protein